MTVYAGPFLGTGADADPWRDPPGCTGRWDLRSRPGHAIGQAPGPGLFECAVSPGANYNALGDGALDTVPAARRSALASTLGLPAFQATRLGAILQEIAAAGDPAALARWGALRLEPGRVARIRFGSIDVAQVVNGTDPRWLAHVEILKAEYAAMRLRCADLAYEDPPFAGGIDRLSHRRLLAKWTRQFSLGATGYRQFLGALPDEGTAQERTSITDNFNGADSDTVGDGGWTERGNGCDFDNVSGRCKEVTNGASPYFDCVYRTTWGGGADYYVQCVVGPENNDGYDEGLGLRRVNYSTYDSDCYHVGAGGTSSNRHMLKRVSGSRTDMGPGLAYGGTGDVTLKLQFTGSGYQWWVDGVSQGTGTDTALSAAGDPVMVGRGRVGATFDDFVADDGAAAAGTSRLALLGVG